MRLFLAINLTNTIKDRLSETIEKIKAHAEKGNFTRRENLHLTLVFLGEVLNATEIKKIMDEIPMSSMKLSFGGLGKFRRSGGDIYWVGVEQNQTLQALYDYLYQSLLKAKYSVEEREYRPHLTLGRQIVLKDTASFDVSSMHMIADRISLMKSEQLNGKLTYTEIYAKTLQADE